MAVATIADIRAGLQTRLATITGLNAYAQWTVMMRLPAAVVQPADGDYGTTHGGGWTAKFTIFVLVSAALKVDDGQTALDGYLEPSGSSSIAAAIEADPDLGGLDVSARCTGFKNYGRLTEYDNVKYPSAIVEVEVLA